MVKRVESVFEAKKEGSRTTFQSKRRSFQSDCFEKDFKAKLVRGIGLGL